MWWVELHGDRLICILDFLMAVSLLHLPEVRFESSMFEMIISNRSFILYYNSNHHSQFLIWCFYLLFSFVILIVCKRNFLSTMKNIKSKTVKPYKKYEICLQANTCIIGWIVSTLFSFRQFGKICSLKI